MSSPMALLPGNVRIIRQEAERLTQLAELHEHGWRDLHLLRTDSWSGPAASAFDDVRRAEARAWSEASDCYTVAATALMRYAEELGELQRLAESVVLPAQQSGNPLLIEAARQSLDRWTQQEADSAAIAARALREVTARLRVLGQQWPEWTPGSTYEPPAPARAVPQPRSPKRPVKMMSLTDYRAPGHELAKRELCDAVFRSWQQ